MARENQKEKKERGIRIMETLVKKQPDARCTLNFETDWQLLFAAILASQCTDERVNMITDVMFSRWPSLRDYVCLAVDEVEEVIKSCGLYKMKAKSIIGSAQLLLEEYAGTVPSTLKDLLRFPGVGQKIANLLLGELFSQPRVVVDTHCGRISRLLGFTKQTEPKKVEKDLEKVLRKVDWIRWGHHMVELGRTFCRARCRQCASCPISSDCKYAEGIATLIAEDRELGVLDKCY